MIQANIIAGALPSVHGGAGRLPLFICAAGKLSRGAASVLAQFLCLCVTILCFIYGVIAVDSSCCPNPSNTSSDNTDPSLRCCRTCQQFEVRQRSFPGALVTADDVAEVVEQLGFAWDVEEAEETQEHDIFKCHDCRVRGAALTMLEVKEAGEEELREAFTVFDANRDGYITPTELWMVMRRLALREGMMLEECRRMVEAFDLDGDGKISFAEFRSVLEMAC